MSKFKPNFTQIPNFFLDEMLSDLEKGELKVILYVMRRTYGFQKKKDRISFSQLQSGVKTKSGRVLDKGTGLGRETLSRSISLLEEKGLLIVDRENNTNTYRFNVDYRTSTTIELVPQSNQGSTIIEPELVPQSNLQKKEKESYQKKENTPLKNKKKYLKEIPQEDIEEFTKTYKVGITSLKDKAEQLYDWCIANGKSKKDYKAFLRTAIARDFGKRSEQVKDILNY